MQYMQHVFVAAEGAQQAVTGDSMFRFASISTCTYAAAATLLGKHIHLSYLLTYLPVYLSVKYAQPQVFGS